MVEGQMTAEPLRLGKGILAAIAILALGLMSASSERLLSASRANENKPTNRSTASSKAPVQGKDLVMPFRVGETLSYRVAWSAFSNAASLEVTVPERRNLFGWTTWHFRAALHTQTPVRNLFTVDDEFDSYTDAATMETRQYESYLNELGKKAEAILHFIPIGQTPHAPPPEVIVQPGTRDPVGVLYALRQMAWQRTPEFRAPLYDGHEVYQVTAKLDAQSDMVNVAAGTFSASRVAVRLSPNGKQTADIIFAVWLANDAARTPVQFQAQLPFGSIRAELQPAVK
jgi:hypothetical protein